MIVLLSIFLFSSYFQCVFSTNTRQEQNVSSFNEFIERFVRMNGNGSESKFEATLPIAGAAGMLESVEKNVAQQILASPNEATVRIDEAFEKMRTIYPKFGNESPTKEDKTQFLLLLLSFAIRLAFTIGSEQLEEHGFQIQMDSFVLAYELFKTEVNLSYNLRHYKDAILTMEQGSIIKFRFAPTILQQRSQEYSFRTILYYVKERGKERVRKLIQLLKTIAGKKVGDSWDLSVEAPFMGHLMFPWHYGAYRVNKLGDGTLIEMKNFGVNLAKLMLRNKEQRKMLYFEENENAERVLHELLKKLESDLAKHQQDFRSFSSESSVHYEDAVQIDWSTKKEFSSMAKRLKKQMNDWEELVKNCGLNENGLDMEKVITEYKQIKGPLESFNLDGHALDVDLLIRKMGDLENVVKKFNEIQTEKHELEEQHGGLATSCLKLMGGCKELSKTVKEIKEKEEELKELSQNWHGLKENIQSELLTTISKRDAKIEEVFGENF